MEEAARLRKSIGTKNESSLHKTLKFQYAGPGGKTEAQAGSFVADGIRKDGEYIEVQTGSFAPLKKKVEEFAAAGKVRIIHPVAVSKIIEVYDPMGGFLYRRKSPAKGSLWNIFDALVYAPELPLIRGVTIEVALVAVTEKRVKDGKGAWRRKGISIKDRELFEWEECFAFKKPNDFLCFVPFAKKEEFTVSSLAIKAGINKAMAGKALYTLSRMKVIKKIRKKGLAWVYAR
jgi:hypothetical protein